MYGLLGFLTDRAAMGVLLAGSRSRGDGPRWPREGRLSRLCLCGSTHTLHLPPFDIGFEAEGHCHLSVAGHSLIADYFPTLNFFSVCVLA